MCSRPCHLLKEDWLGRRQREMAHLLIGTEDLAHGTMSAWTEYIRHRLATVLLGESEFLTLSLN